MRPLYTYSLIVLLTLGFSIHDATAGRFGGARGFGSIRANTRFAPAYYAKTPMHAPIAKRASASKWRGALTGLFIGGLFASLFMGHGFGNMLLSWLFLGTLLTLTACLLQYRKQRRGHLTR